MIFSDIWHNHILPGDFIEYTTQRSDGLKQAIYQGIEVTTLGEYTAKALAASRGRLTPTHIYLHQYEDGRRFVMSNFVRRLDVTPEKFARVTETRLEDVLKAVEEAKNG